MQNRPYQVGITGGIGAGKSTVTKIFKSLHVPVYDADLRARWLMQHNLELKRKISSAFGEKAYNSQGLNRDYIANEVFNNKEQLLKLNSLVHPSVGEDYNAWMVGLSNETYVIKEAALLFESGSFKMLDCLVNVFSPISVRVDRIKKRDPFRSENEIRQIIDGQLSEEDRKMKSDFVIVNDEKKSLIKQALSLHEKFKRSAKMMRTETPG